MPLGGNLVLTEIAAPESFWGRTLAELALPKRFRVIVSTVRHDSEQGMEATIPDPHKPLKRGDILMLVGTESDARHLTERV